MSKHTPGPWVAMKDGRVRDASGETIAALFGDVRAIDDNTLLVAAAPDLLEMLEMMAAQHFCGCRHPACKRCKDDDDCADVIAKAKGEKP